MRVRLVPGVMFRGTGPSGEPVCLASQDRLLVEALSCRPFDFSWSDPSAGRQLYSVYGTMMTAGTIMVVCAFLPSVLLLCPYLGFIPYLALRILLSGAIGCSLTAILISVVTTKHYAPVSLSDATFEDVLASVADKSGDVRRVPLRVAVGARLESLRLSRRSHRFEVAQRRAMKREERDAQHFEVAQSRASQTDRFDSVLKESA